MHRRSVLAAATLVVGLGCAARPVRADQAVETARPASAAQDEVPAPAPNVPATSPPSGRPGPPEAPGASAGDEPASAVAVSPPSLRWDAAWTKFGVWNWVLTGASLGLAVAKYPIGPREDGSRGGWWIDEDVRDGLRIDTASGRSTARSVSDVTVMLTLAYPYFDAIVVAGFVRDSPEVAMQLSLITTEVLAVTMALQAVFNVAVSRERPYGRTCGGETPVDSHDCLSNSRYFSFFSGHSSQSFAAASVSCAHHLRFSLYGKGAAAAVSCASGYALATTTATLRIAGDKHYFTDVLTGAAVGTLVGLGLPWLLHYRHRRGDRTPEPCTTGLQRIRVLPLPTGLMAMGAF